GVKRQQSVLSVDRPKNTLAFGYFQDAQRRIAGSRLVLQRLVTGNNDGARNRGQVSGLSALLVVSHELVDLLANDLALVRLVARRDAPLEEIPAHFRCSRAAPHGLAFRRFAVVEHLEADQLVDIAGRE